MVHLAWSLALLGSCASGQIQPPIQPDWKILTDFTATYKVDMTNVIAIADASAAKHPELGPFPFAAGTESGVIQADIVNEKLHIRSHGRASFSDFAPEAEDPVVQALQGAQVMGIGEFLFDGSAGVVAVRAKVKGSGHMGHMGPEEFCVKVELPPSMFPPKAMVKAGLEQAEQQVDASMAHLPPHETVTIDGESVAVWSKRLAPPHSGNPNRAYAGIRLNGAPYGAGLAGPQFKQGEWKWNPLIKFPSWKHGAGEIREFSCTPSATTSAAKFVANPEASRILAVFDELIARMRSSGPMDTALKSFPLRPSAVFKDAAAMELSAIQPDWKLLTDFTATFKIDMKALIAVAPEGDIPYTSGKESGVIQADIVNKKLHIKAHNKITLNDGPSSHAPQPLWGAHMHGHGDFLFDGPSGIAAVRSWAAANVHGQNGAVDFCVKVEIPQSMMSQLPSSDMIKAQLEQNEQRIDAQLGNLPPHQEVTIDGEHVALWSEPIDDKVTAYVGFRHNGAPFGAGVVAPSNGHWDPLIKFPTWTAGAGEIEDFSCIVSASTSAAMLVNDPQASKLLDVFDNVIAHMHSASSLDGAFSSSLRPSLLFKDAAAKELSALGTSAPQAPYLPVVVVAVAAGAMGAFVALAVMKVLRQWSSSSRREALLANMA